MGDEWRVIGEWVTDDEDIDTYITTLLPSHDAVLQ